MHLSPGCPGYVMALWWGKSQDLAPLVRVSRTSVNTNFRVCRGVGIPQPGSVPEGKGTGKMVYTTTCDVYLSSTLEQS